VSAVHDKRAQLAVLDIWQNEPDWPEEEVDTTRHHLGHGFSAPLERDVDRIQAGAAPETLGAQMGCAANAHRGKV
jgi:hypothetical protein